MQVAEAISRMRASMHDVSQEYDDLECIFALNMAIHDLTGLLVAARYPDIIAEADLAEGDNVPDEFFRTCGTYPMRITGGKVHLLTSGDKLHVRYYTMPADVTRTGSLPFRLSILNSLAIKIAIKILLNENEYDISQDTSIQSEITQALQLGAG